MTSRLKEQRTWENAGGGREGREKVGEASRKGDEGKEKGVKEEGGGGEEEKREVRAKMREGG